LTQRLKFVLSDLANQVVGANLDLYQKNGFKKPWGAYVAVDGSKAVGTCAFKSPPHNGRVEIAYFTFPENEGRKIATKMAKFGNGSFETNDSRDR
jgi:ribosomal-protein-alanine N-acetyltransferase